MMQWIYKPQYTYERSVREIQDIYSQWSNAYVYIIWQCVIYASIWLSLLAVLIHLTKVGVRRLRHMLKSQGRGCGWRSSCTAVVWWTSTQTYAVGGGVFKMLHVCNMYSGNSLSIQPVRLIIWKEENDEAEHTIPDT